MNIQLDRLYIYNLKTVCSLTSKLQAFIHKKFGYRGVISLPYQARLIDYTSQAKKQRGLKCKKLPQFKLETYYQVLMDPRDVPYKLPDTEVINYFYFKN